MSRPLVDVHAHFSHSASPRADWEELNRSRLAAGTRIGITLHIASILGSWGRTSPIYFPSPDDVTAGNEAMRAIVRAHPSLVKGYVAVNPNYTAHALEEIERGLAAGMVGVKLAASLTPTMPASRPRSISAIACAV